MPFVFKSDYWRLRADEVRHVAEGMRDTTGYQIMQRIADDYDELATKSRARELREHIGDKADVISINKSRE